MMKKTIIAALTVLFSYTLFFGQENIETPIAKSFIGLTGGYANAMGNFVKTDYDDDKSGFSSAAGFNFGLEGAYFFNKHIGIGGLFSSSFFNANGLQALSDGYQEAFEVDSTTVSVKGTNTFHHYLIGPYFSWPVKKMAFDARVLAGFTSISTPQFKVDLEDQTNATFYQNSGKGNSFAFQAGLGLRYPVAKKLCAKISMDFFYTKSNVTITNTNRVNNVGRLLTEYKQPVGLIYFNLSMAYQFGD